MKRIGYVCSAIIITVTCISSAVVRTGLDNITDHKDLFQGQRVGVVANHTAHDRAGRFIVDVLREMPDVNVVALFSPEHGLYGMIEAGEHVAYQVDAKYKLPVYSLYGKTLKPTKEMLEGIDMLVFDMQEIGARFYTYVYTMSLAMEAAAESGKRFVVLDRPNPINGVDIEGPILEPEYATFVGLYPIPVRYGMTIGELARMFNDQGWLKDEVKADLTVIPMTGWRRAMWYDQTGLVFIKPSPNIPNVETAAVYPGLCLLEGTNVSEGRGTEKPFLQFGAPWIDAQALTAKLDKLNLPGVTFGPTSFTPTSSKHKDVECHGVRMTITDRNKLEPFRLGVCVVDEIARMYPNEFKWRVFHFNRLCGTSTIRQAIVDGQSPLTLQTQWKADLEAFHSIRKQYLLYSE